MPGIWHPGFLKTSSSTSGLSRAPARLDLHLGSEVSEVGGGWAAWDAGEVAGQTRLKNRRLVKGLRSKEGQKLFGCWYDVWSYTARALGIHWKCPVEVHCTMSILKPRTESGSPCTPQNNVQQRPFHQQYQRPPARERERGMCVCDISCNIYIYMPVQLEPGIFYFGSRY